MPLCLSNKRVDELKEMLAVKLTCSKVVPCEITISEVEGKELIAALNELYRCRKILREQAQKL
jgi:hypothetical protein